MKAAHTVLVVDHDTGTHFFLRSILERERYGVLSARSALEVLHMLQSSRPGVVVLPTDFLVREGGWALAEHIREVSPDQAILLLKSADEKNGHHAFTGSGPYGVLNRPIHARDFVSEVERLINGVN